jgi:hypothetical protein
VTHELKCLRLFAAQTRLKIEIPPTLRPTLLRFLEEWLGAESNRRHVDFQSTALPTELPSRFTKSIITGYLHSRGVHYANFRDWGKEEPIARDSVEPKNLVGAFGDRALPQNFRGNSTALLKRRR